MRRALLLLAMLLTVCAFATTASAAIGGPGPTPDFATFSVRPSK